ncbi:MAG: carboxypeptidase-like regulatory domain-containing protein [Muribaculaceae bacterium]|nr:carboxypeptidase-like regulatory domain-containing protein [Muribaculaceae bacterium]
MKKVIFLIALVLSVVLPIKAKIITVTDSSDKSPITGATIIGNSGIIKGLTDNDGRIMVDEEELPITIRCIGYEPKSASTFSDTISLNAATYQLNEVVITPFDRPVKRVVCFAREYTSGITGADTMQYYCEYMAEAFVANGKVKGYRNIDARPTPKGYKRYARITKNGVDSIFSPKRGDDITELSWFDFMAFLPDKKIEVPAAILEGSLCDTVQGKYGPQFIYRKKGGQFTKTADVLSNHKNRQWTPFIFKLIGMTTDITAGAWTLSFVDNAANSYGIDEFMSGTYNIHLIGRGKWLKKIFDTKEPIEMDAYLEIYPVEKTNLTVDEYKEIRDASTTIPFQYPKNIQPLSPAIARLIKNIEGK